MSNPGEISSPSADENDAGGWESASSKKDDLAVALEKEKIIKDIMQTQEGLRALLSRIEEVTTDISKTSEENATLQTYLDNMTRNTAMFAGQKSR
ncbi:hypothetical protein P389DRAFT_198461 [Cystobasidium minutum MCA 4210]|uniref:uncharacterized protein n=1 Tax=Cystobasidium minutum MCA 4210 TaxID=1397322 RepID=UPI0034CF5396|eukprot:jgi/Rhomi1/198461/gm1.6675_g